MNLTMALHGIANVEDSEVEAAGELFYMESAEAVLHIQCRLGDA